MGAWSTKINGSDEFLDAYELFYAEYNQIKTKVEEERIIQTIKIAEAMLVTEETDLCLVNVNKIAIIKGLWECGCHEYLLKFDYNQIKKEDLIGWKELEADEKTLKEREKELTKFFEKIQTTTPKNIKKPKKIKLDFPLGTVLMSNKREKGYVTAVIVGENFSKKALLFAYSYCETKPTIEEILDSNPIVVGWDDSQLKIMRELKENYFAGYTYYESGTSFDEVGKVEVRSNNMDKGKGIHARYSYFLTDWLLIKLEYSPYNGYSIEQCGEKGASYEVRKEKECWGWKHIRQKEFNSVREYCMCEPKK